VDPGRWQSIARIGELALEQEPTARAAFLDEACKDDPELRRDVDKLLAQDLTPSLLDRPVWETASRLLDDPPSMFPGAFVGHYRIDNLVGAGGMGEVFRATDPRLNRSVAVKILPPGAAIDPQLRERFNLEAQAGGTLAHPHICTVHDVGRHDDVDFLVMEYLQGETLEATLGRGPLPLQRVLRHAIEIASALDHAHRHGIVHRDVKPANIMITPGGAKLMDFGIATVRRSPGADSRAKSITRQGAVVGTVRYMSPEHIEGNEVDHRSDIFSFGAVIHEMVTGQPAFSGDSAAGIMAAILEREPPAMATLQQLTPPALDHIVRRCLAKSVVERWQSAGDVMRELEWCASGAGAVASELPVQGDRRVRSSSWELLPWGIAAGFAVASALFLAAWAPWSSPAPRARARYRIEAAVARGLASSAGHNRQVVLSPDGTRIAYVSIENRTLMIHELDRLEPTRLPGTEDAGTPFFSPDSKMLGFFDAATSEIRTVLIAGGAPRTVSKVGHRVTSASWGSNDTIVFSTADATTGLMTVPAHGGQATVLTRPDPSQNQVDHVFPFVLPDSRTILFTIAKSGRAETTELAALDTKSGQYRTLVASAGSGEYVQSGHLVYVSGRTLYGALFDPDRLTVVGEPVALEEDIAVERGTNAAQYDVSRTGTLVFISASAVGVAAARSLVWVDRHGREEPIHAPVRAYHSLRLSPDGTRVALDIRDEESDTWVLDFRRTFLQRVTFTPRNNPFPVWTPDGQSIVTGDAPGLERWPSDGSGVAALLTVSDHTQFPQAFTPDGQSLVLTDAHFPNNDLSVLAVGTTQPRPLLQKLFNEGPADLSPDGRWLAYQQSDESGRSEIYITPFPEVSRARLLVAQGTQPAWGRNARDLELFYIASGMLTNVRVRTVPEIDAGPAHELFSTKSYFAAGQGRSYDVSPDGQRFVFIKHAPGAAPDQPASPTRGSIVVDLGWMDRLKARLPKK